MFPLDTVTSAAGRSLRAPCLPEAHFPVRLVFQVCGIDEAHARWRRRHYHGLRIDAIAGEPRALQQVAVGHATGGEYQVLAGSSSQVV